MSSDDLIRTRGVVEDSVPRSTSDPSLFVSPQTKMHTTKLFGSNGERRSKNSMRHRKRLPQSCSAMRWFLVSCSCFYLLSESNGVTVEDDEGNGRKRFLRTAVAAALTEPSPTDSLAGNTEEVYDYESYHAAHKIPVPALSTTMMGLQQHGESRLKNDNIVSVQHSGIFSFAGTNQAMKSLASEINESETLETHHHDQRRGPLAFAGTNQAMLNFASGSSGEEDVSKGRRILTTQQNNDPLLETNMWLKHMPHVWEVDTEQLEQQAREADSETSFDFDSDTSLDSAPDTPFTSDSDTRQPRQYSSPSRTDADLDNGRYLVGLEMRDIKVHQQIIIDYHDTNEFGEKRVEPLRIKFIPSDGVNSDDLLPLLLEKSFKESSELWSSALLLVPVTGRIFPSVGTCGSASIPLEDREKGVNGADILIYISNDNRFCGGASMHSAVCDFDQNMRPLVGNINICTKNIPTNTGAETLITPKTLDRYTSYITTETGRVLGASTSFFRHYKNPDTSIAYGTMEKTITCVDGTKETIQVPNMISAKLESNKGGTSCFGGFLDDHLFFGEHLSAFQSVGPSSLSPLTLALLEDSSWYIANYTVSSEIPFGRGAGCQFARGGCIPGNEKNNWGFHCDAIDTPGCDPSHSFKASCDLLQTSIGSSNSYCPMFVRGAVDCSEEPSHPNQQALTGEYYGKESKCFNTDTTQPMCLRAVCNERDYTIDVHYADNVISCSFDGQIIDVHELLRIECPRIAAVCPTLHCPSNCSGRGVCDEGRDGKHTCICDNPFDESPGCWH
eukprot:scaffold4054_cov142-Skeletonema_menzelii.AAC.1